MEQERRPHAWALRCAFEERGSHVVSEKCGSKPRILYLHKRGSRILEQKCGPRIWSLRRAFEERGSRVASERRKFEHHILYLQNRLQLQNIQFVDDERNAFIDVQHFS